MQLPESNEQGQGGTVNAVKYWLKVNSDWLLILDNVEDIENIIDFIPLESSGHILLTTRTHAMGDFAQRIQIDKMEPEVGALFLLRRASIVGADDLLDNISRTERNIAKEISQAMDGLPLGIDQAGAYIEGTNCGLSGYLDLFQKEDAELLKRRGKGVSSHPEPISTTWTLSFQKVQQASPTATDLLRFCAFLHPDAIPIEIITEGALELGPTLQSIAAKPIEVDTTIEELLKFSLVRRNPKTNTLTIHRLVQTVLKDEMNDDARQQWAERTVRAVSYAFPIAEYTTFERCQRYFAQAQACSVLIDQLGIEFKEAAELLSKLGRYLLLRGQYVQAEPLLQHALKISEKLHGPEHSDVADCMVALGRLYNEQGKYAQAESLLQHALKISEKLHGQDSVAVAHTLATLGKVYIHLGKYSQAELFIQHELTIMEKVHEHEPEHLDIAECFGNLGALYWHQYKFSQAEPFMKRAIEISEKNWEPNHPLLALYYNNLAMVYEAQDKLIQAGAQLQRVVKILERTLGPKHPDFAGSLDNLAGNYRRLHRFQEAERLHKKALSIREKALGSEHLEVALSLNNLALVYHDQGRYSLAEPLYQRALTIEEKALELEHPNMAKILNNYASLLRKTKRKSEAAKLEARAEAIEHRHQQEHNIVERKNQKKSSQLST